MCLPQATFIYCSKLTRGLTFKPIRQDYAYGPGDTARDLVLRLRHLDTALELRQQASYNNAVRFLLTPIL